MGKAPRGISKAYKKDGSTYYRASITYKGKHISLGSYDDMYLGCSAYTEASALINDSQLTLSHYEPSQALAFAKYVSIVNFRDNGIYFKTPIYLLPNYFLYYLSPELALKFDKDDLFFYSSHTIQQRGNYRFICHYGSQYGILSRYGIHPFAVEGRDYRFANGDNTDYRYHNLQIINHYMGVTKKIVQGKTIYETHIHVRGQLLVGRYTDELTAAIAYNKAADLLERQGFNKQFIRNYITNLSPREYADLYHNLEVRIQA